MTVINKIQGVRLILCAASLAAFSSNAWADRYVVVGFDLTQLKNDVRREGGAVGHNLRYHHGFIAELSAQAAARIQQNRAPWALVERDEMAAIPEDPTEDRGGPVHGSARPGPTPPPQPPQSTPWGINAIGATLAWGTTRGAGVLVCVVDTGIQKDHPDLHAGIAGENFTAKGLKAPDPAKWGDDNGHGTHVAGTIAALDNAIGVVGVAPQAGLFAAKVLDSRGSGYMSWVAEGIRSCVDHGADVINMSLGSASGSTLVEDAVIYAAQNGVVIVAAAGNESGPVSYPAKYPQVVAVSAVDAAMQLAYFSNFGPEVAFAAPGVGVLSTTYGSSYATYNGTSMASPHVAGVAALMVGSGSQGLVGHTIGLTPDQEGQGFIDAPATVANQPTP